MRPENIVDQQHRYEHAHKVRRIVQQTSPRLFSRLAHQSFRIQSEASFTSFAVAASLSPSTYKRSIGSVPLNRNSLPDPSPNTNFPPSVRSTETTFLPRRLVASTPALRI